MQCSRACSGLHGCLALGFLPRRNAVELLHREAGHGRGVQAWNIWEATWLHHSIWPGERLEHRRVALHGAGRRQRLALDILSSKPCIRFVSHEVLPEVGRILEEFVFNVSTFCSLSRNDLFCFIFCVTVRWLSEVRSQDITPAAFGVLPIDHLALHLSLAFLRVLFARQEKIEQVEATRLILCGHAGRQLLRFGKRHELAPLFRTVGTVGLSFAGKLQLPLFLELLDISGESSFCRSLFRLAMGHDGEGVFALYIYIYIYLIGVYPCACVGQIPIPSLLDRYYGIMPAPWTPKHE